MFPWSFWITFIAILLAVILPISHFASFNEAEAIGPYSNTLRGKLKDSNVRIHCIHGVMYIVSPRGDARVMYSQDGHVLMCK